MTGNIDFPPAIPVVHVLEEEFATARRRGAKKRVLAKLRTAPAAILDLGHAVFLDSRALSLVAYWTFESRRGGVDVCVLARSHRLQALLELAGVPRFASIAANSAEAFEMLGGGRDGQREREAALTTTSDR